MSTSATIMVVLSRSELIAAELGAGLVKNPRFLAWLTFIAYTSEHFCFCIVKGEVQNEGKDHLLVRSIMIF